MCPLEVLVTMGGSATIGRKAYSGGSIVDIPVYDTLPYHYRTSARPNGFALSTQNARCSLSNEAFGVTGEYQLPL